MFLKLYRMLLSCEGFEEAPANILKTLDNYLNSTGTRHDLPVTVRDWLSRQPDIRPDKPVMLYRGLFFANSERYTGNVGERFMKGKEVGDPFVLTQRRCASWTYDKDTATRYALNSKETDTEAALFEFNHTNTHKENPLGVVLGALIKPKDILCDIEHLQAANLIPLTFGEEYECIVKPVPIKTEIISIYRHDNNI